MNGNNGSEEAGVSGDQVGENEFKSRIAAFRQHV